MTAHAQGFRTARVAPEEADFRPALPLRSSPGLNGTTMPLSYKEQLLHPNWQRRRLEILHRDNWTCRFCYDTEETLHVHHKHYIKGRMAWEYGDEELVTLCAPCHRAQDERDEEQKLLLARLPIDGPGSIDSSLGVLAGYAHACGHCDLEDQYQKHPASFVQGEIAGLMEWFDVQTVSDLAAGLKRLDDKAREAAVRVFIATLPKAG